MTRVVWVEDAREIRNARVLFDTNIWVMIEGFNEAAPQRKVNAYSDAYEHLLRSGNQILYNEYIVNEFCNTCARIDFNARLAKGGQKGRPSYKEYRRSDDFRQAMKLIREACLNITEACTYAPVTAGTFRMEDVIDEICEGRLDFTDIVTREFCRAENVHLMTDDADFHDSGLLLISANRRLAYASAPA